MTAPIADGPDTPAGRPQSVPRAALVGTLPLATSLAACGGGSSPSLPVDAPTVAEASRFLAQASMGASRSEIARVQSLGYAGWLDAQFALPASTSRWDWLVSAGLADVANKNSEAGFDAVAWRQLLSAPDTLRQRITLALSEIFVTAIAGLVGGGWRQFAAAAYLDLLESHAFGSHRDLLQQISLSPAMGEYLTFRASAKANPVSGALPDENYARELMQLFTIGLQPLHLDGTPVLTNGEPTATYGLSDITGLARVFTGWDFDLAGLTGAAATATPDFMRRPMKPVASRHETGAKGFLGTTIPAGTDALQGLTRALDAICAHPNVAPFFCRQLIQRLVTSNPSPAYVARVAAVFNDDGHGARGSLRAVIRALLLDAEARGAAADSTSGKLREPMLRFAGWARAYSVSSPSGAWAVGSTADPATRLGQSPLRSPTVFNFFRPGYLPPSTAIGSAGLAAPEFQITNESSVIGVINFLQRAVAGSVGDLTPDYSSLLPLADDASALLGEINLVLAAGQLGTSTVASLATAVGTMPSGTDVLRRSRINAALLLVLAAPEFVVLK